MFDALRAGSAPHLLHRRLEAAFERLDRSRIFGLELAVDRRAEIDPLLQLPQTLDPVA